MSILWCLGCNWGEEVLRGEWSGKAKKMFKTIAEEWKNLLFFIFPPIRFLFWFCFCSVRCLPGVVTFGKNLDVVLYGLFWRWPQILVVFGMFCSVWVSLGWLGKNRIYVWVLTCGKKRAFWSSFVLIDCLCSSILFSRLCWVSSL